MLEALLESGAIQLVDLLGSVALRHQRQVVAVAELGEGLQHVRNEADRMLANPVGHAMEPKPLVRRCRSLAQGLEALDQVVGEVLRAVAVFLDIATFDLIQRLPHLHGGEFAVVDVSDEFLDRLLEEDVVLPEGVVGIEEEPERRIHQFSIHQGVAGPIRSRRASSRRGESRNGSPFRDGGDVQDRSAHEAFMQTCPVVPCL